jgi:phosphoribosylglycinamide formyltransferase-1
VLNIHPSLLPKYSGLKTHQRALDAHDRLHGASIHFVTEDLDGGPVIVQAQVEVESDDDAESLAARVLQREHQIYPLAIRWFAEKRLSMDNNGKVLLDGNRLEKPVVFAPQETIG